MRQTLQHPADQLVTIMHRMYAAGLTTMSGGNLSVREPDGRIWVTPGGVDKGGLTRHDMVCLHPDGKQSGFRKPTSELALHQAIYRCGDHVRAILHAHSSALVTFSLLGRVPDVNLIPNVRLTCGPVAFVPYARMGSVELAEQTATAFSRGHTAVILENHGVCLAAESLDTAYRLFETLEFAARSELLAHRLGPVTALSEDQINLARTRAHTRLSDFRPKHHDSEELSVRRDMTALIQRAIQQQLFTSSNGTMSQRLHDGAFLITPFDHDRRHIEAEHLVLVRHGMKEAGKVPSRAVFLHELIYRRRPEVQAIIGAQPQHLMAFALTENPLAMDLMPESYVMLRSLPRQPYGINYLDPQKTADLFTAQSPAILLAHDGIIVTGRSLLQAFDRFEVSEFTARACLSVPPDLAANPLGQARTAELDRHYPIDAS